MPSEYLQFLILTGVRMNEARSLDWKNIDFKSGLYTLPDPKNRQTVELPLPRSLKEKLLTRQKKSGIVFPVGERVYQQVDIGMEFTNHDLRRTFGSLVARHSRDSHLVQRLLRHGRPSVTGLYIQRDLPNLLQRYSPVHLARPPRLPDGEATPTAPKPCGTASSSPG